MSKLTFPKRLTRMVRYFYALIVAFILDILKNSLLHVKGLSAGHAKTINICNVLVSIL